MTTHLVISDIHEDIESFKSLLEKYRKQFHDIWFLGDVAGHGEHLNGSASALECYQILYEYRLNNRLSWVAGNWEKWIPWPPTPFTTKQSRWRTEIMDARQKIDDQDLMKWIADWNWKIDKDEFTLTHGWIEKLADQGESEPWETYLEERHAFQVTRAFLCGLIHTRHVLVGHTHNPGFFRYNGKQTKWFKLTPDMIDFDQRYDRPEFQFVLNPGSLGGARDEAYNGLKTALIINTDEKSFRFISA